MIDYRQGQQWPVIPGVGVDSLATRCPHIQLVLDIGHIGGYTQFKQMFEYGVNYQGAKCCRIIDNSVKSVYY